MYSKALRLIAPLLKVNPTYGVRFYKKSSHIPELASKRYKVNRGQYAILSDADISHFESLLGKHKVISDIEEVTPHNIDFLRTVRGSSRLILKPHTTEEVSAILNYCNAKRLAVCPQSGNTGLVGGSVPVFDEIILSLQSMNKIEDIDEVSGILTCQSGCILETLEEKLQEKGLCMPLDLGAKGSCLIGGNVSTNAGGLRLIRYGNLHGSVLGVEAVKADGEVLDLMSHFKKDNTGYHLKHLFVGSEGTLGIVTKVAMFCPTAGKAVNLAFLGMNSFEDVKKTFLGAKRQLGEILSSVELIDAESLDCSVSAYNLRNPIGEFPFYMLIETTGSNSEHDEAKIDSFLTNYMEKGVILDGTVTNEPSKMKDIWQLRETIAPGILNDGYCFKYDISLPLSHFYEIVLAMKDQVQGLAKRVCGYGHIGDQNLHLNVSCAEYNTEIHRKVEPFVYEYTAKVRGSISAEHGIGFLKPNYLKFSKSPEALDLMREIKQMMDPNGILNPYKVLPRE